VDLRLRSKGSASKVIISRGTEVAGNMCVEGVLDAEGYEIKGVVLSGGFIKNNAAGEFLFDQAGGGGASQLDELSDVTIAGATTGEFLRFNGSQWVDTTIADGDVPDILTLTSVLDTNGNTILDFSATAAAVNFIRIGNTSTGFSSPFLAAQGSDSDISFRMATKGTGTFILQSNGATTGLLGLDGSGNILFGQSGGASELDDLSDVVLSSPVIRNVLVYDGANWRNEFDMTIDSAAGYHVGAETANDTWRMNRSGDNLAFARREANSYNDKVLFTPGGDLQFATSGPKIVDSNGNTLVRFDSGGSAVNFVVIQNQGAANAPRIRAESDSSANIDLNLVSKGTGAVVSESDFQITSTTDAFYFGPRLTDGTWRIVRNGNDLQIELRESNVYNSKGSFTP